MVVATPPLPWNEGTAQNLFRIHAAKLIKLGWGETGSTFQIIYECTLRTGSLTTNNADSKDRLNTEMQKNTRFICVDYV